MSKGHNADNKVAYLTLTVKKGGPMKDKRKPSRSKAKESLRKEF